MDDQEHQSSPAPKKRRKHTWRIVLFSLIVLLLISFTALFLGLYYLGERILRRYVQEKILVSSNGLYHVDFKKLHVNLLTGKVALDSFELIPDTSKYRRLKEQGKVARSLYHVSFSSLTVDRVHFRQVFAGKRINFRQLTLQRPMVSIVGYPDTVAAKRNKWQVIYEDLYPAVSGFFNDFHIDSVKVNHGMLLTSSTDKKGRQSTGEYEFSSVLKDVSVNPFSYYNRERVFYSRDVYLAVHNFETHLADSLYSIRAEELGFSLTKSILYGKKVTLVPNFKSKKIRQVHSGDLFRIELPEFSISGIDLYRAMTGREVEVSKLSLTNLVMQVYRNKPPPGTTITKKTKKKITLAGLYTVIAKELRFVAIDSLYLENGSIEFYSNVTDSRPELHIGRVNLELSNFRLDSLAHLDQSRIFYSRAIELELEQISLALRDNLHHINASAISLSTRKSLIDVHDASIFPDRKKNSAPEASPHNTMQVRLPRLTFTGIDLKKVFNKRILDFNKLIISEPDVRYTRYKPSKNPDSRFKKPEDFFETENEEVVYNLLKKYLWVIRGNEISIASGFIKFSSDQNGNEIPLATSIFDLSMQQFLIDSVHGMNEQGYFYSRDFDLDLQSVSVISPDSLKYLQADRVHIITSDSLIEADNIHVYKSAGPLQISSPSKRRPSLNLEFSLHKLQLTGLNHKKLFLEKILKANQIVFDNPLLFLKTSSSLQPEGPPEETHLIKTNKFVHTYEIGRCLVRKGAFSYDGGEDRKASYFSLKDIEFAVVNATVHIPEKGLHDGLIKFDSLQLKVFPLRAVIADSSYAMEARSLEVHSYPANIILQGVKITPLKSWDESPGVKSLATVTIPEIRFNGFYFERAIFDNRWLLDSLYVERPSVYLEMKEVGRGTKDEKIAGGTGQFDPAGAIKFPPFMKTVAVNRISVTGASAGLTIHGQEKNQSYSLSDMMLEVTRFRVDSATRSNPLGTPLFNADDITFTAPGYQWLSRDSMYTFSISRFGFSTGSSSAFIDTISVTPRYSRKDFSVKLGYQTDRIELFIPRVNLSQVDLRRLVSDRQLHVSNVSMKDLKFGDYRDKRLLFPTWQRPPMPAQMVEGIRFPVCIDTIVLSNGFASYEEQVNDEPGRIFFDRMNATLTGFCTPSGWPNSLDLHGKLRIMGVAPAEAWFHFQRDHPRDTFNVRAAIDNLDLTAINPMLGKLVPASIKRGTATATDIVQLNGNNSRAIGQMYFRYENLAIRLHPTKPGTWNRLEQSLLSEVVNLLLSDSNPNDNGKLKHGVIYFERDQSKGFFNFVWKSLLSGIKSSVGINSKIQKEIKKQEKNSKK